MTDPIQKTHFLLVLWGDVDPETRGPYKTAEERDNAAFQEKQDNGDENGIYALDTWVDDEGKCQVSVEAYSGGFFREEII